MNDQERLKDFLKLNEIGKTIDIIFFQNDNLDGILKVLNENFYHEVKNAKSLIKNISEGKHGNYFVNFQNSYPEEYAEWITFLPKFKENVLFAIDKNEEDLNLKNNKTRLVVLAHISTAQEVQQDFVDIFTRTFIFNKSALVD